MEPVSIRTPLRRLAAAILLLPLVVACAAFLGACSGDDGEDDVEALLDRAFGRSITSADLKIDAQVSVDGLRGFERPFRLQASGPYSQDRRGLPLLDVDLTVGSQGVGQTLQFGVLRTADRAFVKFGGEFYEQPRRDVARANRRLGARVRRGRGALRELGLAPRTWIVGAREEGEERVAGVGTRHVSGRLDIRSMLRDFNELVRRSGSAVVAEPGTAPDPLSSEQLDRLAGAVRNPSFDVYIGEEDDAIRRLSAQLEVSVPEEERSRAGGIEGGALRFSIEFSDLDGEQLIEAPTDSRPLADLIEQLGGLSALGGVGTLGGDGSTDGEDEGTETSPRRLGDRDEPDGRGPEGGSPGENGVDAFRRYSDCLDRAGPDDTRALSRCAELLR